AGRSPRWDRRSSRSASGHGFFIAAAISDSRFPANRAFSGFRVATISMPSAPDSAQLFSHGTVAATISARIFARIFGSRRLSNSLPSAEDQGGKQAVHAVPV